MELSYTEQEYLKEQEFLKNNQEEVLIKVSKAKTFKIANGYSLTMSKLMAKWNCSTPDDYRRVRTKHRKENYVGPRKVKKIAPVVLDESHKEKKQWKSK